MERLHIRTERSGKVVWAETLWAQPLGDDRYRLENEPLSEAFSYGDEVTAYRNARPNYPEPSIFVDLDEAA